MNPNLKTQLKTVVNEELLLQVIQAMQENFPKGSYASKSLEDFALDLEGYIYYGNEDESSN